MLIGENRDIDNALGDERAVDVQMKGTDGRGSGGAQRGCGSSRCVSARAMRRLARRGQTRKVLSTSSVHDGLALVSVTRDRLVSACHQLAMLSRRLNLESGRRLFTSSTPGIQ